MATNLAGMKPSKGDREDESRIQDMGLHAHQSLFAASPSESPSDPLPGSHHSLPRWQPDHRMVVSLAFEDPSRGVSSSRDQG